MKRPWIVAALFVVALFSYTATASAIECHLESGISVYCSGETDQCYTVAWNYEDDCESTITIEKTGCLGTVWLPVASGIDPSVGSYEDCMTLGSGSYKYRVTLVCGECDCTATCQHVSACKTCPD